MSTGTNVLDALALASRIERLLASETRGDAFSLRLARSLTATLIDQLQSLERPRGSTPPPSTQPELQPELEGPRS